MSLVSNAEIKKILGLSTSNNDSIVTAINDYVDSEVKGFLKRPIEAVVGEQEVFSEFKEELHLKYFPVTTISAFTYGQNNTALVAGTDYDYDGDTGIVYNLGAHIYASRKINITYNHGYATVPNKIKMAVLELCKLYYGYFTSENNSEDPIISSFNVSTAQTALGEITFTNQETINRIMTKLRRWRIRRAV